MKRALRFSAAVILFAALGGCDEGDGPDVGKGRVTRAEYDSTGIEIVESEGVRWEPGEGWRVLRDPVLQIGGPGDRFAVLFRVRDYCILENGTVVISNSGGRQLLFLSPSGDRIAARESIGEGPGEYQDVDRLAPLPGSAVAAYDNRLRRIVLFDSLGAPIQTIRISTSVAETGMVGAYSDSLFVLSHLSGFVPSPTDPRPEAFTRSMALVLHGTDGRPRDSLVSMTAGNTWAHVGGTWGFIPTPFGTGPMATMAGGRLFVGHGEEYEVRVLDDSGATIRIMRNGRPRVPLSGEMIRRYRDRVLAMNSEDIGIQDRMNAAMALVPWPRALPAFSDLLADSEGCLWVCEGLPEDSGASCWVVYDRDGGILGGVEIPEDVEVRQIGEDFVLGMRFISGFPEIVVFRLQRL